VVLSESWHEERDRLVKLLKAIESGDVTHVDEDGLRQLQATNPDNIAWIRSRIAELNQRLDGSSDG
jgi:hypothetical protein